MTTATPRRRGGRLSASISVPQVGPAGAYGGAGDRPQQPLRLLAAGPGRQPHGAVAAPPVPTTAPIRLPPRTVRWAIAAAAASTRSRLSQRAVPKSRLADRSTASQVSSSRSATVCRTCGTVVRAVTGQSIRRTSSPGRYSRDSPASLPGPGSRPT